MAAELSEKDKKVLEEARKVIKQMEGLPASQRFPVSNPDKYSFPIGLDDNFEPFPVPREEK